LLQILFIYQRGYTLPWPFLLTSVPVESLFGIFHILYQVQLHMHLGFHYPISACVDGTAVFFPGHPASAGLNISLFSFCLTSSLCSALLVFCFLYLISFSERWLALVLPEISLRSCQLCSIPKSILPKEKFPSRSHLVIP